MIDHFSLTVTTIQSSHLQEPKPFAQCLCHLYPGSWLCPLTTAILPMALDTDHTEAPVGPRLSGFQLSLAGGEKQQEIRGRSSQCFSPCLPRYHV